VRSPWASSASALLLALFAAAVAAAQEPAQSGSCPTPARAPAAPEPASAAGKALARGNALERSGEPDAALAAYGESRRLAEAEGDVPLATLARANAARAALAAGRPEGVAAELEAVVASAALPDAHAQTRLLLHVARTHALLAEKGGGQASRARAAALFSRAAEIAQESGDLRQRSYALGWLAELYESEGRREQALSLARQALQAGTQADAPDALYRWHWLEGRVERAQGHTDAALGAYREAAATVSRLRRDLALSPLDFRDVLGGDQNQLYFELVDLLLQAAPREPERARRQALLAEARNTLELQKNDELREYFRDECLVVFQATAPDNIPGTVIVYPIPLPDRLEIVVSGPAGLESFVTPVDRDTLAAEVQALRRELANRTSLGYEGHAETLYEWVIRPIEPLLREAKP
jgi:tetratricopeptide (TPR) repeat protein